MLTKNRGNLYILRTQTTSLTRLAVSLLAVAGWLGSSLPSLAADDIPTAPYRNAFRSCAGRLLRIGISTEAAATACARALYPVDLARCVTRIEDDTEIAATDALETCRLVRRPIDLARCVVGISENAEGQPIPGVLNYCGRSLLPASFGECVVGLTRQTELAPPQAMETCISASDRPLAFEPTFIPQPQPQQPTLQQTTPSLPPASPDLAPQVEPTTPAPAQPQDQTPPPGEQTTPANPQ